MGLSVNEQIANRKKEAVEETAQVATSQVKPVPEQALVDPTTTLIGTEGNELEPVDGTPIKTEQGLENQFMSDFGEDVDGGLIAQMIEGTQPPEDIGITQQENPDVSEHDVISPTGQVVTYRDPKKAEVETPQPQPAAQPAVEQSPTEVDLSNYVAKADHDEVVRQHNELQGKFSDLQGKVNKGLEGLSEDNLLILKQIKADIETTPFGFIVKDYYDGKINANRLIDSKPVSSYMPEGREYDPTEAVNAPGSDSWNARLEWEDGNVGIREKYAQAAEHVNAQLKAKASEPSKEDMENQEQQLRDKLYSKIPQAKVDEEVFNAWLKKQTNIYFPMYIAFAQMKNMNKKGKLKVIPNVGASGVTLPAASGVGDTSDRQMEDEFGD